MILTLLPVNSLADEALGSDPRIRTLIYGKNDVFKVNAVFGYQTVIELQEGEKIQTLAVGNPNIFKIVPSHSRIFIKAFQNGQHTNMTLISDKRMYQFELTSNADNVDDIMYLVRFVYPGDTQYATEGESGPMNIYSPISLPKGSSSSSARMPSMPTTSRLLDGSPQMGTPAVPLSIQFKDPSQRKGLDLSPVNIEQKNIGPLGFYKIDNKFIS